MEDEVERVGAGAVLRGDAGLNFAQQFGAQLDVARLVDAVHVAESESCDVAALVAEAERFDGGDNVIQRRVQAVVDVVAYAVFFSTDDTDFNFENRVDGLHAGQDVARNGEVLLEGNG